MDGVEAWKLCFNSGWQGYCEAFDDHPSGDANAEAEECDGLPCHGAVSLGPYIVLIFSRPP